MGDNNQKLKEFNRINRKFESLYHAAARKQGLSDSAFIILYELWDMGDGCLQRDICDTSSTSKQTIHSATRKLEQEGYVYLKPGRGREMQIFLTEEGRGLVREKIVPVVRMEIEAFGELEEEESAMMLGITEKYLEHLWKKLKEL